MRQIKLNKGLSYTFRQVNGEPITIRKGNAVDVCDADFEYAMETGYFVSVTDGEQKSETPNKPEDGNGVPNFDAMSKAEVFAYAESLELDTSACKTKADCVDLIMSSESVQPDFGE